MKTRIIAFGIVVLVMCTVLASAGRAEHDLYQAGCGSPAGAYAPYGAHGAYGSYGAYGQQLPYGAPAYVATYGGYPAAYGAYGGHDPYYLERKRRKNRTRNIILGVAAVALLSQLAR